MTTAKGFLGSLFDFSFSHFITTRLIKFLFGLYLILTGFGCLMLLVRGFDAGFLTGVGALVVAPILFLVLAIFGRLWLETAAALFRCTEYLREIAASTRAVNAAQSDRAY